MAKPGESRDGEEPPMTTPPTRRRSWLRRVVKIVLALAALAGVAMIGLPPALEGVIGGTLTVIALGQPPRATTPARHRSWPRDSPAGTGR